MNYKLLSSILSIFLTIFLIGKNSLSFNPIRFHCPNYVLNSYLYLFLSLSILFTTILTLENINLDLNLVFASKFKYLFLILSILLIFSLLIVNPKYFVSKHILWVLFLLLTGLFIYPIYKERRALFYQATLTTLILVASLSLLAFYKPDMIKDSWFMALFIGLIVLLISQLLERVLASYNIIHKNKYNKMLAYLSIGLFSLWTLFDTKEIIKNSENCINPDYINQSLDILINSLNIFTGVVKINE